MIPRVEIAQGTLPGKLGKLGVCGSHGEGSHGFRRYMADALGLCREGGYTK